MRTILAALMFAFSAKAATASEPAQIIVHSVKPGGSYGEIMVEIKNNSDRTIQKVYFNCGVFNHGGQMIGADDGFSENIPAGASDYKRELANVERGSLPDVATAKCRIISTR